jgi:hypothetical protein
MGVLLPGPKEAHVLRRGTWTFNREMERPTFAPSIAIAYGRPEWANFRACHTFVVCGTTQFLTDSTHAPSGKVVDLPDFTGEDQVY